ncbi:putative phage tail protein [Leclercia sp. 1548]|uniref:TipJ family phage tail tip protein n=1 Tax=Leclercia TaxID=83654 RepID=UPI00301A06FF
MATITGAKGGSQKQHTPVEQPDSAQSMARCRMLLALGEGEFAGGLDATRIFLDGTPLGNADGSMNFENVSWDFRPGTQTQSPIPGFPAVENETSIGVSLTKATPWTRAISNTQIDAVLVRIGITGLQQQENDGDIVGTSVTYHIDVAVDGGAYSTVLTKTVTEKLSSLYELTHRINLPKANTGWQIRVVRDNADSTSQMLQNKTQVQAITEVIDARLRYPHTALLYVSFNAKSFSNIPKISCKPKGRIIRIPQNYDPVGRVYNGTWDGTFKWGWSNNPAWIWFDVLTEPRFGLGRRVTAAMLDKWELYRIAQRCDQKVPDGKGGTGTEPRFLFDVYIQSQADAWQVIKDIAAGFNGMTFWGNNMFNVVSDMPADTTKLQILTRASVVGKPNYSSGSEKNRYSSALINFSDPDNHYQDRTTAVMFPDLVKQFKFQQTQLTAIGCTRESEAQRRGGWAVYSNYLDRLITLQTGLDGFAYVPGTVFAFADERFSGRVYGGRVLSYNAGLKAVTTDRGTSAVPGDTLMIRTQGGIVENRVIQAVNGTQLIVATAFSSAPAPDAVFVIDAGQLRLQYFRVMNLTFNDEENTYTITGAEYNASKYDAVDNKARLDIPPVSLIPTGVVSQPGNVVVSSYDSVRQGQRIATLTASWDAPLDKAGKPQADVIAYQVQWRRGDSEWVNVPQTGLRNIEVPGIYEGDYLVRVRAINAGGASSLWATSVLTHLKGRSGDVPKPANFRTTPLLWGVQLDWDFPAGTGDTLQTEIQYSTASTGTNPLLLAGVPYPQHVYQQLGLKAGVGFWYRARLVDRTGNKSAWTDFIQGSSSSVAADYLVDIDNQIKQTDAYKELTSDIADLSDDIQSARDDISKVTTESAATKAGLAQEVTDRKKAIIDEAAARGQALLTEKNERVADISNVNQTIQTTTESLAQQIGQISAGTGSQFDPAKIWYFDSTVEGWTGNGTPTIVDGWIRPANHVTDPWVASPGSLGVNSSSYRFVKLRIRKFGAPGWAGQLRWRGTGGFNDTNMLTVAEPAYDANGIATLEFDNIPWLTEATMNQFRLDLSTKQDATNYYLIDWVALGRPTPGAGMAALQAETTARVAGDQAEATARETLATQIRGGYTGDDPSKLASGLLYTERQARITAQEAEVTARTALEATVNANKASVTQELATLTTEQEAQATTLSGLQTTVGKNTGDITRIDKAVADNNKAQTTALAAVKATTDKNTADISTETTARTDADSALGRRIDSLKVDVDGNTASRDAGIVGSVSNAIANFFAFSDQRVTFAVGETKTMAEITETRKTAADATSAVAEQVTTLKATVEQNGQTNAAAITRINKAVTDLESATATSIQQVTASIGQTNANVQTTSQAVADINGKLSAQWGVKVQVEANGVKRIAGIQLGIDGTGASNFLISADTFAVYNPTTNGQELVFASTGGQIFMRSVFIQDGSIDNGKIGNYIQSSNWDGTGNVGWHINKSGYATFNGVTVRGTIYATDGSFKGRVEATSGSFRGTVEATSFIGDVANTGVYPDSSNRSNNAVSTSVAMAYTDSSNNGLNKNAVVEALIYVRGTTGAVGSTVNITIAGNVRTFTFDVPVGGFWFTARHAATGLTGQRIDASIFVSSSNATVAIYAPTITVTRGTGSFS